jgi:hypothetical protein
MQPTIQNPQTRIRNPSVWQFGLSLLMALALLIISIRLTQEGLAGISDPKISSSEITQSLLLAAGVALCGILLLPSAGYALARLAGWPVERFSLPWKAGPGKTLFLLAVIYILLLVVGSLASAFSALRWWLLPPVHVLAIGLPVLGVVYMGGRSLAHGSPQRAWGLFGCGMTIGPGLIMVIEVMTMIVGGVVGILLIASQPDQAREVINLAERLRTVQPAQDQIMPLLEPYLRRPVVIAAVLAFLALIVPMIEELFKPVGVWLLMRRGLTPAEGFTAGLLSGAGFALVESLGYASDISGGWASVVLIRSCTALMHIFTSGLTGWGLAALSHKQYARFGKAYLGAVLIHGIWNGLTITSAGLVLLFPDQMLALVGSLLAICGILGLFLAVFALLLIFNRKLRWSQEHAIIPPSSNPVTASLDV